MTINEFQAFLDGMDLTAAPTEEQWARIKEKIADLKIFSVSKDFSPHSIPSYGNGYIAEAVT